MNEPVGHRRPYLPDGKTGEPPKRAYALGRRARRAGSETAEQVVEVFEATATAQETADAAELAANNIGPTQIDDDAIESRHVLAGAIVAGKLAAGSVVAGNIDADTITADLINAGALKVGSYLESQGYVPGTSGWRIAADGTVEFESGLFRGDILGATISLVDDDNTDVLVPANSRPWYTASPGDLPVGWSNLAGAASFVQTAEVGGFFPGVEIAVPTATVGEVYLTSLDAMDDRRNVDFTAGLYRADAACGVAFRVNGTGASSLGSGYYFQVEPTATTDLFRASIVRAEGGALSVKETQTFLVEGAEADDWVLMSGLAVSIREGTMRFEVQAGTNVLLEWTDPNPLPRGKVALFARATSSGATSPSFVMDYDAFGPERGQARMNQFGDVWLGAESPDDAPFSVNRVGQVKVRGMSGSPTGGYVPAEANLGAEELTLFNGEQTVKLHAGSGLSADQYLTVVSPGISMNAMNPADGLSFVTGGELFVGADQGSTFQNRLTLNSADYREHLKLTRPGGGADEVDLSPSFDLDGTGRALRVLVDGEVAAAMSATYGLGVPHNLRVDGGVDLPNLSGTSEVLKIGTDNFISEASNFLTMYTRGSLGSVGWRVRGSTGTAFQNLMVVNTNGNVDVPNGHLRVDGSIGGGGAVNGSEVVGTTTNEALYYVAGGYLAVSRSGNTCIYANRLNNGDAIGLRRAGNDVGSISVTTTATSYNTSSDYRLKEDLQPVATPLSVLGALRPLDFAWKDHPEEGRAQGFLAHEVAEHVPQAVKGEKDAVDEDGKPDYQSLDHSKLVPLLVAAVQELTARVAELEG